ncbi:MAG: AAA family ATPase [Bacteroidia bacterium]
MGTSVENSVIKAITIIYENKEGLMTSEKKMDELSNQINELAVFFELEKNLTILFAVMICDQLMGEVCSVKENMKSIGFNPMGIIEISYQLKELKKLEWITLNKTETNKYNKKNDEYEVSKNVIDAVIKNNKSLLESNTPVNLTEALLQARKYMLKTLGGYDTEGRTEDICTYMEKYNEFPFIMEILVNNNLINFEKVLIFWLSADVVFGYDEFNLTSYIDMFSSDATTAYWFEDRIFQKLSVLFSNGYLEFKTPYMADLSVVQLGWVLREKLSSLIRKKKEREKIYRFYTVFDPMEIESSELYFNEGNSKSINKIKKLLDKQYFEKLISKFEASGMNPCLTMIFYGNPGTGKTELVKQLAKLHNRSIFQVDMSDIKEMWIGESERNLKKVFKGYTEALKSDKEVPILLFNEADALLGIRTNVQTSVDQMLNSMQNILLQELEDFKGIFIATTNMINNIDGAFDRRLLFKQEFELPDSQTRLKILKSNFNDFNEDVLISISNKYNMSGGQIQNIKKKFIAEELLFEDGFDVEQCFTEFANAETQFRSLNRNKVGYSFNKNNKLC